MDFEHEQQLALVLVVVAFIASEMQVHGLDSQREGHSVRAQLCPPEEGSRKDDSHDVMQRRNIPPSKLHILDPKGVNPNLAAIN